MKCHWLFSSWAVNNLKTSKKPTTGVFIKTDSFKERLQVNMTVSVSNTLVGDLPEQIHRLLYHIRCNMERNVLVVIPMWMLCFSFEIFEGIAEKRVAKEKRTVGARVSEVASSARCWESSSESRKWEDVTVLFATVSAPTKFLQAHCAEEERHLMVLCFSLNTQQRPSFW